MLDWLIGWEALYVLAGVFVLGVLVRISHNLARRRQHADDERAQRLRTLGS